MDDGVRLGGFGILPPVVKNLLIINGLFFLAKFALAKYNVDLDLLLGLHYYASSHFHLWQILTYMFMHADFGHLFFNMFSLWMFGSMVENVWGGRRFLVYYIITGMGAALCHYFILWFQIGPDVALMNTFLDAPSIDTYRALAENCSNLRLKDPLVHNLSVLLNNPNTSTLNELVEATIQIKESFVSSFNIIGASGAVFGLLLAFGMMFPNSEIYLYFLLPIKAKWFVIAYGALELLYGITGTADGIAHFAHLGGMLFGLLLIFIWRKKDKAQYNNYY
ncbi:MAG: rhomboid family intramembrane serine protease [Bacteroidales bacterium]|nr:rhomboid family intramembrane serine protease [Bacteroidales bacterium]